MRNAVVANSLGIDVLDAGLKEALTELIANRRASYALIASPFIKEEGVDIIADALRQRSSRAPRLRLLILTRFCLSDFVTGASDLEAIASIFHLPELDGVRRLDQVQIYDLPKLHAKIYLSNKEAIVGSSNLTFSGLELGNHEVCFRVANSQLVKQVKGALMRLLACAEEVTEEFLEGQRRLVQKSENERKEFENLQKRLTQMHEASRLCRLPVREENLGLANYYGQMVAYLKWIGGGKKRESLVRRIARALDKSSGNKRSEHKERLAEFRVSFLEDLGIIRSIKKDDSVHLTASGREVLQEPERMRRKVSQWILRWCEVKHHDRSLRELMRPFEAHDDRATLTIHELMRVHAGTSPTDNLRDFREQTSPARNWLSSLGLLERDELHKPYRYRKGSIYPAGRGSLDERVNRIVRAEDNLAWLRQDD